MSSRPPCAPVNCDKNLINQNLTIIKRLWEENTERLGLCTSRTKSKPVQWFIGESNADSNSKVRKEKRITREGVEFYSNGDFYEGEFHKGKCNGSGVYNYFVNGRYEGDWIDGRYDGYGIESWARGSRYRGQYRQGLRHGYGLISFTLGILMLANGVMARAMVLECRLALMEAATNGDRYAGEYFGDKIHGFGVYHFANGHCYEGSWHEGRKQGYGMYTFRNGDAKCGEWDAARKTAESAIRLRRVDEEVNKAVQAANRAATAARVVAVKAVQNQMDGKFCDTNV
ncbi:hypothetical protein GH714_000983 [Hevea brasiliensis]|uniref:Uncharacterized protein n=1 Tax=Hevea brasiliensis TaxID=3981 RepID=A0A6A6L5M7_HEVBR|nr:hypothetical protein GH714_000983 [Hevea brasiliensis]